MITEGLNIQKIFIILNIVYLNLILMFLSGCTQSVPDPRNAKNLCEIFRSQEDWYKSASLSRQRWGVPIPVLMAIIYHESGYKPKAKPPRTTCLFIFPGPRPSSAYGYPQALDSTWINYKKAAGKWHAKRHNFDDAIDFVGWYCHISHVKCKIAKNDAYNLYLAYHEGQKGFNQKTYRRKKWLMQTADGVEKIANRYSKQLSDCEHEFLIEKGCCLWPF
ncbi:Transglycosylase SLT domain-containing protein [Candidatus Magnetomoraceae bacterium gMMP-15]